MKGATIVDLSQPIYQGMPVYPGHVKTVIFTNPTHDETRRMKKDFSYECRGLLMSDHGPTHLDAINHLTPDPNADSIDKISLETFFTPAICLDVSHVGSQAAISKSQLAEALKKHNLTISQGDTVLLWTGHYDRNYGKNENIEWLYEYPGLDREATEWLHDQGCINVGVDAPSIDNFKDTTYPAHHVCLEREMINTENLCNLNQVAGKRFIFCGFPLKILEGTGSPIRAVALFLDKEFGLGIEDMS